MKSGIYIAIFVMLVIIIGGLIWYTAKDVSDIKSEMTTVDVKKTTIEKNGQEMASQKKIDIMTSDDIEADIFDDIIDENIEDVSDFDNVDNIIKDENVVF